MVKIAKPLRLDPTNVVRTQSRSLIELAREQPHRERRTIDAGKTPLFTESQHLGSIKEDAEFVLDSDIASSLGEHGSPLWKIGAPTVGADLTGRYQFFQCFKHLNRLLGIVVVQMKLIEIDIGRPQPL